MNMAQVGINDTEITELWFYWYELLKYSFKMLTVYALTLSLDYRNICQNIKTLFFLKPQQLSSNIGALIQIYMESAPTFHESALC